MRKIVIILVALFSAAIVSSAQQLDSAGRVLLDEKLAEYVAAIEWAGTDVQKEECDFLISSSTDSLVRQHIAINLYDQYMSSKVMGAESEAIHIFDTWFLSGKVSMGDDIDLINARVFADFNRQSQIGLKAPELSVIAFDGTPVDLYDSASGRYSVMYFYDTDCIRCRIETRRLSEAMADEDYPIEFYAFYVGDDREQWQEYIQENFRFTAQPVMHLWDPELDSDFQRKYGVLQTPRMFLVAPDGTILGRGLDTQALKQMLETIFAERTLEYGSRESEELLDELLGEAPSRNEIMEIARLFQNATLDKGDEHMFKQLLGDYLYYLAPKTGEEFREGLACVLDEYILDRDDVWTTGDDSLKVVGFAEILDDLLSKAAPGTRISSIKVEGEYMKGSRSSVRKMSLRKLRGKENIIIFHTEGCHICESEIKAARNLAAVDADVRVFLVNVDKVLASDPALSSQLFDAFDLSTLPFILQTDKKGNIIRRYISLLS